MNKLVAKFLPVAIGKSINAVSFLSLSKAAKLSLKVFSTPRKGKIKDHQKEFLCRFSHRNIQFNDLNIAIYHKSGTKKRILFCHGWESNSSRWKKLLNFLSDQSYDIVMMDAPAHGGSGGSIFNAALYAGAINSIVAEVKPDVLIGHSIGAYSALLSESELGLSSVKKHILLGPGDQLRGFLDRYYGFIGLSDKVRKEMEDLISSRFGKSVEDFRASLFVQSVQKPVIIIHDEDDRINYYYEGLAIDKNAPMSKLYTTKGLGHSLQSEAVFEIIKKEISNFTV